VWHRWALLAAVLLTGAVLTVLPVGGESGGEAPRRLTAPSRTPEAGAAGAGAAAAATAAPGRSVRRSGGDADAADRQDTGLSAAMGPPRTVTIPSLDVRAAVVPLDTERRVLVPPADPTTAGWWRAGAVAGSAHGAAIITGHTVSTGGGVFDDLDRLGPGDKVSVTTARGRIRYIVDRAVTIGQGKLAERAPHLFAQSGDGRLVLVTCEDWNGETYLSNQVVVARPA
jgi:LPXTG-site transpeptidase (sortase) family protein